MNNKAWTIWRELLKSNYDIDHVYIQPRYYPSNPNTIFMELEVCVENYPVFHEFSIGMFKKYYYDINYNIFSKSFKIDLELKNDNNENYSFEKLEFPSNTNSITIRIEIFETLKYNLSGGFLPSFFPTKFNLPKKLSDLRIISSIPIDLSNLPTNLFLLDISESDCKFNLDYLPDSIKVLYLPSFTQIVDNSKYKYPYTLGDLSNLPSSLTRIKTGDLDYSSVNKLIKNFNSQLEFYTKLAQSK